MATLAPRVIVVRRETEMDRVRAVHSSAASARFVLKRKRISLDAVEAAHADFFDVLREVHAAIPGDWRQATILRSDVERFVFGPEDVIVAVGQDGLVANVAKYLDGQPVIGVDPAPGVNSGAVTTSAGVSCAGSRQALNSELPGGVFGVMPCVDHELGYAGLVLLVAAWFVGPATLAAVVVLEAIWLR